MTDVTVVIPTIPTRGRHLRKALKSVHRQTLPPAEIIVEVDTDHEGAGPTRTRGLQKVTTPWTAFLDDDDWFLPHHLETLVGLQTATGAMVCWSWWEGNDVWEYECAEGRCPDRCHRHKDFDFEEPHIFGISYLVNTELAQKCVFPVAAEGACGDEDYAFILQLRDLTTPDQWAHTPEVTWHYNVHGNNTSGQPWRW